jgi:hypothetical protein
LTKSNAGEALLHTRLGYSVIAEQPSGGKRDRLGHAEDAWNDPWVVVHLDHHLLVAEEVDGVEKEAR